MGKIGADQAGSEKVRLDKWLWAARFYKTRALASTAVSGGKIRVHGARAKPSRSILLQDVLSITRGDVLMVVTVLVLSGRRGSATVAQQLYEETEQSLSDRQEAAAQRKLIRQAAPNPGTRPGKKARRDMARFSGR